MPPRRLFTALTLLSFIIFAATLCLWVRSYMPEAIWVRWVDGRVVIITADGRGAVALEKRFLVSPDAGYRVRELIADVRNGTPWTVEPGFRSTAPTGFRTENGVLGMEVFRVTSGQGGPLSYRVVTVPIAYLFVPAAVLPGIWLVRRRRHRGAGFCAFMRI